MIGLLKRYRELILVALLLVLPLGVFFAHAKRPSERSGLDNVIVSATGPVEKGVTWAVTGVRGGWNGYLALRGAHERSLALEHENELLKLDQQELARMRSENGRLQTLLAFAGSVPGRQVVGARVIGVRLDPKGLQLVTVDRGTGDGLERMMPVVVGHGVVGRVHAVTGSTADVLLITDRNSSVAVRVERSRARANVRGTGSTDGCRLEYALRSDDLVEGDLLMTSGTDGVFPRGLPVGKVASLRRSGQGLYQRADVAPAVDMTKLEEVLVLASFEASAAEPAEEPRAAAAAVPPAAKAGGVP